MKKNIRIILYALAGCAHFVLLYQWWSVYIQGGIHRHVDGLTAFVMSTLPLWSSWLLLRIHRFIDRYFSGIRTYSIILLLSCSALMSFVTACAELASPNQQTLLTTDCGVSWQVVPAGEVVPTCIVPPCQCHYTVKVPNCSMQGDSKFKVMFKSGVFANVNVSYDYVITDAKLFIEEAGYLGRMNSSSDDASTSSGFYELAENSVIDRVIKEEIKGLFNEEDVVEFSPSDIEDKLSSRVNQVLLKCGVFLSSMSLVPQFNEQVRLAIDIATANKIYESKNLVEWGQRIAVSKAGAPQINVYSGDAKP